MAIEAYNDLLEQVADHLEEADIGTKGQDIFIERLPRNPGRALMIEGSGGYQADMFGYVFATFRLLARSVDTDPRPAKRMLAQAFDALHKFRNDRFTADDSGLWIVRCIAIQGAPVNIGRDDNDRARFSQNYEVEFIWE